MATAPDFTIVDVLAWARTKPADDRYDYQDSSNCALCRFLKDTGRAERPRVSMYYGDMPGGWKEGWGNAHNYPSIMEPALSGDGTLGGDAALWTFGALVKRLEALCPEATVARSDWARLGAYLTDIELASA